jgi:HTH-type transcriptional regulator/antitoxin HigA
MLYSKSTIAIPPGATIHEQLENRGMSQKEFAQRMDMTEKHISRLINGKVELTKDVALRLEAVLGLPANFWNNLELDYREHEAQVNAELAMEKDIEIAKKFPYAKIVALCWLPNTRNCVEKVMHLRKFFEVAQLSVLDNLCVPGIAFRKSGESEFSDYALAAWAQKARLDARKLDVEPINIKKLNESIPQIRSLTIKKPSQFCQTLTTILAECGVALVFLPHIGGSFLHGATFLDGNRIVMGLTVRGKYADKFWFSLFHELDHIIEGHINISSGTTEAQEICADNFARDVLIPRADYKYFMDDGVFNKTAIVSFAQRIGINPGIVLGRLQKDNVISYQWFNDLKEKYQIADS